MKKPLFNTLACCLLLSSFAAQAYRYTALQDNTVFSGASAAQINTLTPRLHVDVDENTTGAPILISFDGMACGAGASCSASNLAALASAITASRNRWNAVFNSTSQGVTFTAPTSTVSASPCATDGVQVIGFSANDCDGLGWPSGLLGVAFTSFQALGPIGAIGEVDIAINPNEDWGSFDGNFNQNGLTDLNRVLLHEMGHSIGLDHPDEYGDNINAIMNSVAGSRFELQSDDINGSQDLANAMIAAASAQKAGLVGSNGFSSQGNQIAYTSSACLLESYTLNGATLPDGEIALILTQSSNVNEAGRHITGRSGPQATDGSTMPVLDRNLQCPQKQYQGTFVQPPDAGSYFQHLGLFSLDGSLLDSVTFQGTQFFAGGGPEPSATPSATATPTATPAASATPSATATPSPSATPTATATQTPTATPAATPAPTATPAATATPSATPTPVPTATPSAAPTATATPSSTPSAAPTSTPAPTATPQTSPTPVATPTPQPSATASPVPTATATASPAPTAAPTPSASNTPAPSATPDNSRDDGDNLNSASSIQIGANVTRNASINRSDDIDVFSFVLTQRSEVSISSSGPTDVAAVLVNAQDQLISSNDDASLRAKNFSLQELLEPGQYYVKVSGVMGATGPYQLTLSSKLADEAGTGGGGSGSLSWPALFLFGVLLALRRQTQPRQFRSETG